MNSTSIILKNVTAFLQGKTVLDGISFAINANEHLLITGASGSGKTILAKALAGLVSYTGNIEFSIEKLVSEKPTIALVEQHYNLKSLSNSNTFYYQQRFTGFDAGDALTISKALGNKLNAKELYELKELLQQFNLQNHADAALQQLSSGEYKKFQLIKALLQKPQVLILDEPFVGLDVNTRHNLQQHLNDLAAQGIKIIMICQPSDAPSFITHFAELKDGRLIQFSSIKNITTAHSKQTNLPKAKPVPHYHVVETFADIVSMKNVSVAYGEKQILKGINWQIKQGEKWLLKGANGAGKSTLLSLINADNPQAYANDVTLFDRRRGSGESIWDIKKNIGFVSPEFQWYFDTNTTTFQAIASGLFDTIGLTHQLNINQKTIVDNWVESFGLAKFTDKLFSTLSAGRQRLVLLARAAVKNPPLLILDEPCQGLDEQQKEHFLHLVDAICQSSNCTLIYVSHYNNEIPNCIDYMLELNNGHGTISTFNKTILQPNIKTELETA